jgi:hypothetical protein
MVALLAWGDDGLSPAPSVLLRHAGCGGDVDARATCTTCGAAVTARDVEGWWGPGSGREPTRIPVPATEPAPQGFSPPGPPSRHVIQRPLRHRASRVIGEYEHTWRMAHVRGLDGIIVAPGRTTGIADVPRPGPPDVDCRQA